MDTLVRSVFDLVLAEPDYSCLQNITLTTPDRFIFWIGGGTVFLVTLFLIIGAMISKKLREQPGDLIVGIAFSDFLLSIHWMTLASAPERVDDPTFCQIVGVVGVFAGINEFLYNVAFSAFLVISLRNALRQAKIPKKTFHFLNLTIAAGYVGYLYGRGEIGKTYVGTCSIMTECKSNFLSYLGSVVVASYSFVGVYTYWYVQKNASKCQRGNKKRTSFLIYYLKYIVACVSIYALIVLFTLLTTIVANNAAKDSTGAIEPDERARYAWINSIYNVVKLCSPLVLTTIRINDPKLKGVIMQGVFFWKKDYNKTLQEKLNPEASAREPQDGSFGRSESLNDSGILVVNLNKDRKIEITYTLLSCVIFARYYDKNSESLNNVQVYNKKSSSPYRNEKTFQIDSDIISSALPSIRQELLRVRINILAGTFKVYAPEIFGNFIEEDADFINFLESLEFSHNKEQIKESGGAEGGKGGEFFFFSSDKKLIIKTVPDVEFKMLINILERYDNHFKKYPFSLIAKIYGAYTYENTDLGLKFNLIVMKNICGFSSEFVERRFDMKGSKFDRETMKGQEVTDETMLKQRVLKDIDFEKYERKLFLNLEVREQFLNQIELDSRFFRMVNLIDYSFMVYIVDKQKASTKMDLDKDFTKKNPLASIEHTEKPGLYYNMGIIDYLQPYNFQKALERFLKKVKKLNPNLDTSSQKPDYYSSRFIEFIKDLVLKDQTKSVVNK